MAPAMKAMKAVPRCLACLLLAVWAHGQQVCLGGSFSLDVTDTEGFTGDIYGDAMKSAVLSMAGNPAGVTTDNIIVEIALGTTAPATTCTANLRDAVAVLDAASAASTTNAITGDNSLPTAAPVTAVATSTSTAATAVETSATTTAAEAGNMCSDSAPQCTTDADVVDLLFPSGGPSGGPVTTDVTTTAAEAACVCPAATSRRLQTEGTVSISYTIIANAETVAAMETSLETVTVNSLQTSVTSAISADTTISSSITITGASAIVVLPVVTSEPPAQSTDDEDFALKAGFPMLGLMLATAVTTA